MGGGEREEEEGQEGGGREGKRKREGGERKEGRRRSGGRKEEGRELGLLQGDEMGLKQKQRGKPALQKEADNGGTMERPTWPAREGRGRPVPLLLDEHQECGRLN